MAYNQMPTRVGGRSEVQDGCKLLPSEQQASLRAQSKHTAHMHVHIHMQIRTSAPARANSRTLTDAHHAAAHAPRSRAPVDPGLRLQLLGGGGGHRWRHRPQQEHHRAGLPAPTGRGDTRNLALRGTVWATAGGPQRGPHDPPRARDGGARAARTTPVDSNSSALLAVHHGCSCRGCVARRRCLPSLCRMLLMFGVGPVCTASIAQGFETTPKVFFRCVPWWADVNNCSDVSTPTTDILVGWPRHIPQEPVPPLQTLSAGIHVGRLPTLKCASPPPRHDLGTPSWWLASSEATLVARPTSPSGSNRPAQC